MDRQISYNGSLPCSPLPCTFLASRPSIPINHPLPPKPPISMYFHVYTPTRKPATVLRDTAAQHVDHGKPIPVNNDRERPSAHNHTTVSSVGLLSGPHKDSVICPSSEDTITGLENDHDKASNGDDSGDFEPPHPDELFSWIRNTSEGRSCEASVARRSVDNRSGLDGTSSTTSQLRGIGLSCEGHAGDADDGRNGKIVPTKHLFDGSKGVLSATLGSKVPIASRQLLEDSLIPFIECRGPRPVVETTLSSPSVSQSNRHSRKRPTRTLLGHVELAAGRGPQTRARTKAEASRSFPSLQRARPYSDSEDEFLRELMHRKLSWEGIVNEFGRRFAGRDRKSLQGRWSRNLKFEARPPTCSKPRGR
ncbi:hypothetical protein ASPCAL12654 [Aspergillus calidoustus]|uniref:Myb-like domain-containing protein n=1 Tax=Aspergillus calidoustus TaxID=454130 RepID=A0A0U5GI72_ASPCI|nr:hypothetical protein ASPCAL12654 [Aspergillus calidoustus]